MVHSVYTHTSYTLALSVKYSMSNHPYAVAHLIQITIKTNDNWMTGWNSKRHRQREREREKAMQGINGQIFHCWEKTNSYNQLRTLHDTKRMENDILMKMWSSHRTPQLHLPIWTANECMFEFFTWNLIHALSHNNNNVKIKRNKSIDRCRISSLSHSNPHTRRDGKR